ncbi:MAG TPA: V-type ATP synthase subunit E [Treponema sp.]|nr:V-type ATP synthase subunit E [Treponema sp.]
MDVQLQELVDKIKKDGVESAEFMAADIIKGAKDEAKSIVESAKKDAENFVSRATEEADRLEKAAEAAIRQAGRNLLITFRDSIEAELSALVKKETAAVYSSDVLKGLIPSAVTAWIKTTGTSDLTVILNESDRNALEDSLLKALKDTLPGGLELHTDDSLSGGFRIGTRDGAAYYDFSAEAVADLFSAYLNPRVSAILASAAKES